MDTINFASTISALRKKSGLTQSELAQMLHISDKAVSKWENGISFPEVTLFPALAEIFGVTIDYLMTGERRGITIAGNVLTDLVKNIDCYPKIGMLSNISSVKIAVGGCVPNTAIDLAVIDRSLPVSAVGCVGDDDNSRYIVSELQRHNIDTSRIKVKEGAPTSFSDVMSMPNGERTFFHARGANALFSPDDVDIQSLQCSILHIGYIFLLDKFDAADREYGTVMARFLHDVQAAGIKTSVDVVSDSTGNYSEKIIPALKYCDYFIVNEIECTSVWNISPRRADGTVDIDAIHTAMQKTMAAGVKEKVIVHSKEVGLCLDASGEFTVVPSLKIPSDAIKGSVGAGDAFCAGCLYGLYNGYTDKNILEFASAAAASNLFAENSTDGMRAKEELMTLEDKYGRRSL